MPIQETQALADGICFEHQDGGIQIGKQGFHARAQQLLVFDDQDAGVHGRIPGRG